MPDTASIIRPTAVLLGSNEFINCEGYLQVKDTPDAPYREFLRVREIDRKRSSGYYLVLDVDIKTPDGKREVKLAKTNPVDGAWDQIDIIGIEKGVEVRRRDDQSLIVKVEEVDINPDPVPSWMTRPQDQEMAAKIRQDFAGVPMPNKAMQITGEFYAGPFHVVLTPTDSIINRMQVTGNMKFGGKGIWLSPGGFGM